jgi:hypothetical protein
MAQTAHIGRKAKLLKAARAGSAMSQGSALELTRKKRWALGLSEASVLSLSPSMAEKILSETPAANSSLTA